MRTFKQRTSGIALGTALALSSLSPAFADDSEIYVGAVSTVQPNILLILDTSLSMDGNDVYDKLATFDPTKNDYPSVAGCTSGKIFYTVGAGAAPPTCSSTNYISSNTTNYQHCQKLAAATANAATAPAGRWTGKAAQWNSAAKVWEDLKPWDGTGKKVDCLADRGIHGETSTGNYYLRNGNTTAWTTNSASEINWGQRTTYTFYSSRWVQWNSQTAGSHQKTRIQAVKNAVYDMVSSIDGVNIGVMRFNGASGASSSTDAAYQGGVVTNAIKDVTTARNDIIDSVRNYDTNSGTPLSETLHEAGLYWRGETIGWGSSGIDSAAKDGSKYKSPISQPCQRNFNILLTDGRPTWDNQNDGAIETLYGSACTGEPGDLGLGPNPRKDAGRCLDEMSTYLARDTTDLLPTGMDGRQIVKTFTIGFSPNDTGALDFLTEVATDGGGTKFTASDTAQLNAALTAITTEISNISSTFATASIGVNSFNRTATRDDLYFAVFNSDDHLRWDGNLKKYKLGTTEDPDDDGPLKPSLIITGTTPNVDAVDDLTGFFKTGTRSFWSTVDDGNEVTKGGAASLLPTTRTIYTYVGVNPGGTAEDLIAIDHADVTSEILDTVSGTPTRTEVLAFAKSSNPKRMGDPLHSQPSVVSYGTEEAPNEVVYVATNDGFLHAVDAATGVEKWAYIPEELLPRLKQLVLDPSATTRTYGLDGDIRILKLDFDADGVVDGDDVVWLFVGMRRGGNHYYALDITNPNDPQLMWKASHAGSGESWSPPTIARVAVDGATQNNQKLVLIYGGGYDSAQENYVQVADDTGNAIFMVDAKSGIKLWSAGVSGHNLNLDAMTNSITGRVAVIDINGDQFADRMYAADLGGRVFRFDIFSGNAANTLVTGSVFAKLGNGLAAGGDEASPDPENTRRFYNGPDVALIQRRGSDPYYNIAIGSGYRGHPLHKEALDRFYSLRDKQPYFKHTANNALTPITEATTGFVNITSNPMAAVVGPGAPGWMLVFNPTGTNPANLTGEKVLNESTTVNGVILFSTYTPQEASSAEPCRPTSVNRVYALRADNGHPALDLNNDGVITNADLFETVKHEGILGGVNVGVLRGDLADTLNDTPGGTPTVCLAGMHVLGKCVNVSDSVRTYWRKDVDQQ